MQVNSLSQTADSPNYFPLNQYNAGTSIDISQKSQSIILMDINGNILYINPAYSENSGYSQEEALELNLKSIISGRITNNLYLKLWEIILEGKEWNSYLEFKKKNGILEMSRVSVFPVKNITDEITHFIIVKNGISELGEQEKQINNLLKLGYFGNIFCSLMHELKSHFALIKMNFSLLKPATNEKSIYSIIDRDLERVNRLFVNFSQFSKDKEPEIIDLNIHNVIDYSYPQMLSLSREKSIKFVNDVEPIVIKGDYQKLKCVFKNLIENAIDAIEVQGEIEVWSKTTEDSLTIYFKDNGIGIKNCDKVFEPFYTTKSNGTGLGLAIVKKIIEEHKGVINLIKCMPGETVFEIKYPI